MLEKIEKIIKRFFWVPFCLAFIGYFFLSGGDKGECLNVPEAIYASAALYFVSPVVENNNVLIIIAKILALVVTANFVLSVISKTLDAMSNWYARRFKDSTAVYTDSTIGKEIAYSIKHGYIGTTNMLGKVENTKDHIIMFNDDAFNLGFYEYHKETFSKTNRRVFIGLNHFDTSLLRSSNDSNVHYFCLDEFRARDYWKQYNLYDSVSQSVANPENNCYKIAIIGWNAIAKAVFKQGYLNNIYNVEQKIEYHVWDCGPYEGNTLNNLNTGNGDTITAHTRDYREEFDEILVMNRVIVTNDNVIETVQDLIRANGKYEIYCCMEDNKDLSAFFSSEKIHMFGNLKKLLTVESIKSEILYRQAKLINYDYVLRSAGKADNIPEDYETVLEQSWSELDGFLKGSNIARADYYWIEKKNYDNGVEKKDRWNMEHIRWCRYYYYNGWKKGEKKDAKERTHPDLVEYNKLPINEQKKDGIYNLKIRQMIEELIEED